MAECSSSPFRNAEIPFQKAFIPSFPPSFLPSFLASILRCSRVAATSSIWRIRDARIGFSLFPSARFAFQPNVSVPGCVMLARHIPFFLLQLVREKKAPRRAAPVMMMMMMMTQHVLRGSNFRHDLERITIGRAGSTPLAAFTRKTN